MLSVVVLSSVYSALLTVIFVILDAVDVAMTEAAVGTGVSTILLLCTLRYVRSEDVEYRKISWPFFLFSLILGSLLVFGVAGLPYFGDPNSAVHQHLTLYFIENTFDETGIKNIVTAVLASYRGFDTMGEVIVIFTAGVGVLCLLRKEERSDI